MLALELAPLATEENLVGRSTRRTVHLACTEPRTLTPTRTRRTGIRTQDQMSREHTDVDVVVVPPGCGEGLDLQALRLAQMLGTGMRDQEYGTVRVRTLGPYHRHIHTGTAMDASPLRMA